MPINTADTNLKVLYGLDESGPASNRVNSGNFGHDIDMTARNASGTQGAPVVSDGRGGRAVNTDASPGTPWTSTRRWFQSIASGVYNSGWAYRPRDPGTFVAGEGVVMGVRIKWPGLETGSGGGADKHWFFGCIDITNKQSAMALVMTDGGTTNPSSGGAISVLIGETNPNSFVCTGSSWDTITGTPGNNCIDRTGSWYRCIARVKYSTATHNLVKVWLFEEETGSVFTWEQDAPRSTNAFPVTYKAATLHWCVGCAFSETDNISHPGYIDECWYYDAPLTDAQIEDTLYGGLTVPWTAPSYTFKAHDVRVAWTNEAGTSFPVPRALPNGTLYARHPAGAFGTRMRLYMESVRVSRPFAHRRTEAQFDGAGARDVSSGGPFGWENLTEGLVRVAGELPPGACIDVRNFEFSGLGPRRRKGFKVRRDVGAPSTNSMCGFASFRTFDDQLHLVYKAADRLYYETGGGATQLDTSWPSSEIPVFGALDNRLIILTGTRQKMWRGTGIDLDSFGQAAPTTGSVAATAGSLVGTFAYAYTWYDPITGDETAPKEVGSVTLATQGALISSMATSPTDTRFTQQRVYRTVSGGASPEYFLIATQNNATTYTDSSGVDGTIPLGQTDADFITAVPPDTFGAVAIHQERAFYYKGTTYGARIYWSEANEPLRFWSGSFVTCEGPVTAVIGQGNRIIAFTARTVEIIESDWSRDEDGDYQIRRTVISRNVGCLGPRAAVDTPNGVYWIDRRGIYTLQGDTVSKVSPLIDNILPYLNTGLGYQFTAAYNHRKNQLWFFVAMASPIQTDSSRFGIQIVMQLGTSKWTLYQLNATFGGQWDDDLNGVQFGCMDEAGVFKELESYEGDGLDDSDDLALSEGTISSISSDRLTITPVGSPAWTVDALRGYGVTFRDVSTGRIYYYTIIDNEAGTYTLDKPLDTNLVATDEYYIGGMNAYFETTEQNFGSSNRKVMRFLYHEFDNLTISGRLI
jgi:hypothetical protein